MAKNLTVNLRQDPHSTTPKPDDIVVPATRSEGRKKTGRPKVKHGEYKTINISVPVEMLNQMEVAKLKYGNNLTAYVNAVIRADLEMNYQKYLQLQEIMNS